MSRTMPMPIWVGNDTRTRVLIEAADVAKQIALAGILERGGYAVLTCGGPEATDDRCALVEHDVCNGVARADVVVHAMRPQDPRNREVLRHVRSTYATVPVVVEAPRPYVERHPEQFEGCEVVFQPVTAQTLVGAIERVLDIPAVASGHQP